MKQQFRIGVAAAALLLVAGCSRSVSPYADNSGPPPLAPVPTGQVAANQLPPPPPPPPPGDSMNNAALNSDAELTDGNSQGDLPSGNGSGNTQVASVNQPALSRNSVLGAYKVTTDGGNCQIILSLTKWSGGYRAASRGCPGKVADVSAWDVSGSQVILKDSAGSNVANLNSSGNARYQGQTTGGQSITLYR
ncbi:protease inhibitor Inh/omp19 family protein [Aurantimonas sp. 22II-16-19i]|uniref:protease inhibitor Inh/omp19 family protein n=1 Tax=Aurantimonas sp. 22II-16-19i TaxID=1317114 RepID=UPI0009F7A3C2|nr:protease inhibitor Inh/omp19 family protein [Aurantimonas sp. 22II-16-19i]ORE94928.1 outer membrane lipoprotein omp19 [Aurantimonas sp. 22II-16-19i]